MLKEDTEFGGLICEGIPTREDIQKVIVQANTDAENKPRGCRDCQHYFSETEDPYSKPFEYCSINDGYGNLRNFPFKRAPKRCFQLNFWASAFSYLINGITSEAKRGWGSAHLRLFHRADQFGRFPIGKRDPNTLEKQESEIKNG